MHDLAGHTLAAMLLHVTGARHVLRRDIDEAEQALLEAETIGRSSLDQIRATVASLRTDERGTDPPLAASADLDAADRRVPAGRSGRSMLAVSGCSRHGSKGRPRRRASHRREKRWPTSPATHLRTRSRSSLDVGHGRVASRRSPITGSPAVARSERRALRAGRHARAGEGARGQICMQVRQPTGGSSRRICPRSCRLGAIRARCCPADRLLGLMCAIAPSDRVEVIRVVIVDDQPWFAQAWRASWPGRRLRGRGRVRRR